MTAFPSGQQIEIGQGAMRAVVVEVGGGLRTLQLDGQDILDGYGEDEMSSGGRGQLLMPWPNRIKDGQYSFRGEDFQLALTEPKRHNAIHGLVRWANWIVAERGDGEVTMRYRLYPSPGYPFALDLSVVYTVSTTGLTVTTRITNVGVRACPCGAGQHPYIRAGSSVIDFTVLRVPADSYLEVDEQMIPVARQSVSGTPMDFRAARPIGDAVLDIAYTDLQRDADGNARVELRAPDDNTGVTLWMDALYTHVMIFTGDTVQPASRRRHGLAVEPMTCPPNAFVTGENVRVLEPDQTVELRWGVTVDRKQG